MDYTAIQSKVYSGYAKAAGFIGDDNDIYRPSTSSNPIIIGNKIRTIRASYNAEDMKYSRPNKYGKATWYGLFDGSQTQVGDYLVGAGGTFFIAAQQALLPILCVSCNRVGTIYRPTTISSVGAGDYTGLTTETLSPIMTNWPCSILQGTKGERAESGLPSDTRNPWWYILLPYWQGVTIKVNDVLIDDLGRRYVVSSPELTDLGWRISASLAVV